MADRPFVLLLRASGLPIDLQRPVRRLPLPFQSSPILKGRCH